MEEKKKRFRPTLTAYREQEETIHRQCVELDAWREKYRELDKEAHRLRKCIDGMGVVPQDEHKALKAECMRLSREVSDKDAELERLMGKVTTLEMSNSSMSAELERRLGGESAAVRRWKEKAIANETEVLRLQSRGFFARLFNL